ncbi:MAG: adenylate cyclase regulatory domain-containing protein [Solirubrobacteraceae bacterium]
MDWEAEGLLEGVEDEAARRALLDELHAAGASVEELRQACEEERLALLPVERLLSSEARYTAREIAEKSGLDLEFFLAHRRTLGLAVPGPDERVYGEPDLESARMGVRYREAGFPDDDAMEVHRVLGRGMARYVEALRTLVGQTFLEAGTDEQELAHRLETVSRTLLPMAGPWLEHVFALHLREVLRHDVVTREQLVTGRLGAGQDTAVAFADLVGFTALGESVPMEELTGLAGRLSRLAGDVVEPPVRLVKQIGDAVMLVCPQPAEIVETALRLVDATAADEGFPAMRAGVAFGPAVNRWGDWYGSTVNVASRLTTRARPASVLVTAAVREAIGDGAYSWSSAGEKKLKGLSSPVRAYRARRA